jgi:hypothetical protein
MQVSVVQFRPWAPPTKIAFDLAQLFAEKVPPGPSVGHDCVHQSQREPRFAANRMTFLELLYLLWRPGVESG